MEGVWDMVRAALPWVAIGLTLAGFFAKHAAKDQNKEACGDYGTEGMCIGMCMGTALGTALENNTGIGISLGMLIGLTVGTGIKKEKPTSGDCESESGEA